MALIVLRLGALANQALRDMATKVLVTIIKGMDTAIKAATLTKDIKATHPDKLVISSIRQKGTRIGRTTSRTG
jgi:hypothetical protein